MFAVFQCMYCYFNITPVFGNIKPRVSSLTEERPFNCVILSIDGRTAEK